jgi:hypothetical protein
MSRWAGSMTTSKNLAGKPALLSARYRLSILISALRLRKAVSGYYRAIRQLLSTLNPLNSNPPHESAVVEPSSKYGHITTRSPTFVAALMPPSWDRMKATDGSMFSTKRNAERWRVP